MIFKNGDNWSNMIEELLEAASELDMLVHYRARKFDTGFMRECLGGKESSEVELAKKILPILEKNKKLKFPVDFLFENDLFIYEKRNANGEVDFEMMALEAEVPFMWIEKPSDLTKAIKWLEKAAKKPKDCHFRWYVA